MTLTLAQNTDAFFSPGTDLVQGMVLFVLLGAGMAFGALIFAGLLRPRLPNPIKAEPYECGEPSIGPAWVQFDLRFYVVALIFLVFDVEIALFWPWAVVFGGGAHPDAAPEVLQQVRLAALYDMLFFFGVIVVGFVFLWRFGYLDWVRAYASRTVMPRDAASPSWSPPPAPKTDRMGRDVA